MRFGNAPYNHIRSHYFLTAIIARDLVKMMKRIPIVIMIGFFLIMGLVSNSFSEETVSNARCSSFLIN